MWQQNQKRLLALLAQRTSWEEAPDLLQETFLRVYKARPKKFNGHLPRQYLVRAAETTATDYIRKQYATRTATTQYLQQLRSKGRTAQARAEHRVLLREIQEAAQQLSPKDQEQLKSYSECSNIAAEA